jgi:hypothetical protein
MAVDFLPETLDRLAVAGIGDPGHPFGSQTGINDAGYRRDASQTRGYRSSASDTDALQTSCLLELIRGYSN